MSFRVFGTALWIVSLMYLAWIAIAFLTGQLQQVALIGAMLSRPHIMDRATPILIILLFAWILFEIARQQVRILREHLAVANFQLKLSDVDQNMYQQPRLDGPRAARRFDFIMECLRRDPTALHEALPALADLDAGELNGSYTPLHVYAWTLPVLGFIGTAGGMASAIDGFKDVLRGGQVQVDTLAGQLSQSVIPGLSSAFETTILALAAALVSYLCTSALRLWDQEALNELDKRSVELLSHMPHSDRSQNQLPTALSQIASKLQALTELPKSLTEVTKEIRSAAEALALTSNRTNSATAAIENAAALLTEASKELRETVSAPYHITIRRDGKP